MSRGLTIALIGAILVLAVGVAGLAAYIFMRPVAAAPAPVEQKVVEKAAEPEVPLSFYALKNFLTDLKVDTDGRMRYVDVTISLGFKDAVAMDEAKKLEPQIRDLILTQLRTKTAAELLGNTGKEKLAESLKEPLATILKTNLKSVLITDMVVQ